MSRRRPCRCWAYYNEHDPFAAAWLRELIKAGHIAPGIVDERSIEDVCPTDLAGFTQCHFFAGIGVWSYALRCAGWPDSRPVWTGSCPCQPFSAAGKGAGVADERHLWPAFFHLIRQRRPLTVFGEQVASRDGLVWLDLVSADLEGSGYTCGAVDTCAAGFGAPHIRQRLYWVANTQRHGTVRESGNRFSPKATANSAREKESRFDEAGNSGSILRLGDTIGTGLEGYAGNGNREAGWQEPFGSVAPPGEPCGMDNADSDRCRTWGNDNREHAQQLSDTAFKDADSEASNGTGPVNGFWRNADWLFCRDGKWRSVEPGTFPLAHGAANRLGRLRGYGNALCAPQAQAFIEAVLFYEVKK